MCWCLVMPVRLSLVFFSLVCILPFRVWRLDSTPTVHPDSFRCDHDFHSVLVGGRKKTQTGTPHSAHRATNPGEENKQQRSFLGGLHLAWRCVQFLPRCIFTDVLAHSTCPPVGGDWAKRSASRNKRRAARCPAGGLRSAAAADWSCALGDALSTVALHDGKKKKKKIHLNNQLSQPHLASLQTNENHTKYIIPVSPFSCAPEIRNSVQIIL